MVNLKKWVFFLGPKSDFCHTTPILVDDLILALGMTVNFPPWERFFDFPFRSYSCFRKKILLTAQKVFPLPTVGFYCTVKALALSARRPFGPARFARGLDKCVFCFDILKVVYQSPRNIHYQLEISNTKGSIQDKMMKAIIFIKYKF